MTLEEAKTTISGCVSLMANDYFGDVFNEWTIIALTPRGPEIQAYSGPREESFRATLSEDIGPLKSRILSGDYGTGDFEFSREGAGQRFDAFVVLGENVFLVCNHTEKSMPQITADKAWIRAQKHFVQLCDAVRSDPVRLDG